MNIIIFVALVGFFTISVLLFSIIGMVVIANAINEIDKWWIRKREDK